MFSHRDLRAYRASRRLLAAVIASTAALALIAVAAPVNWVGLVSLAGLVLVGTLSLAVSERVVDGYATDLREVAAGKPVPGVLRVEVHSVVGSDRVEAASGRVSPNSRRRPARAVAPTSAVDPAGRVTP